MTGFTSVDNYSIIHSHNTTKENEMKFTGITFMDKTVSIEDGDLVLIEGVEYEITDVYEDGTFFAHSADGEENFFEIGDIG